MKKFGRKKKRPEAETSKPGISSDAGSSFYSQRSADAPLDEYTNESVHRTSRHHSPGRRRETTNRASNKEMTLLVLKIFLIPVVLGIGYFGLKFIVGRFEGPSEKDRERWESTSRLMEQGPVEAGAQRSAEEPVDGGNPEELEPFLDRMEQAERLLRSAEALEQRAMSEEAISRLKEVLRFAPEHFSAQKMLLHLYLQTENYAEAVPLCLHLLKQDGMNPEIQMDLLTALHESGQTESSLMLAERILEREPENVSVMEVAAYAYAAQGDNEKALQLYEEILEREPDRLLALEGAGTIHEWQDEPQQALPYFMQLVRLDPRPRRYQALARSYAQQEEAGKAVIFMGQAASLYGEAEVIPWLSDPEFDAIRETVEFRSFADQVAGARTREAIEELRRRQSREASRLDPVDMKLPSQTELEILRPNNR